MTDREKEIFKLIEANPLISQAEIATRLNITRTSVGVHISNLVKKGYIMGKGYIMAYSNPVSVIGGANVDIQGKPDGKLLTGDSNPGQILSSLGGVARNIAENMRLLGLDTRLHTAVGDDKEGLMIKDNASELGIDIEDVLTTREYRTSSYMYILDEEGELANAIADMAITKLLNEDYFKKLLPKLENSPFTLVDTNLTAEAITYLAENLHETKLVLDPVSGAKAVRAKEIIGKFYAIKFNRIEAEAVTGMPLDSNAAIERAGQWLLDAGVKKVFITLGSEGVFFCDSDGFIYEEAFDIEPVNITGAGDAFSAAMVYGFIHELAGRELVRFCLGAAALALSDWNTINPMMSVDSIEALIEEQKEKKA